MIIVVKKSKTMPTLAPVVVMSGVSQYFKHQKLDEQFNVISIISELYCDQTGERITDGGADYSL